VSGDDPPACNNQQSVWDIQEQHSYSDPSKDCDQNGSIECGYYHYFTPGKSHCESHTDTCCLPQIQRAYKQFFDCQGNTCVGGAKE
jgi:hypothetical protein